MVRSTSISSVESYNTALDTMSAPGTPPAEGVAPAVEEEAIVDMPPAIPIVALNFVIRTPDLRNGDIANITQAAPKSSIDRSYKWVDIAGLPFNRHISAVEFHIRGSYAQLVAGGGANATEQERAANKKKAIVLGSIRAGAAEAYRLTQADMNTSECCSGPWSFTLGELRARGGTATALHAVAQQMEALTNVEVQVIGALVYLGMAVPVLQGASLVNSGHHYLPTTKNQFMGMKKQALGVTTREAANWIEAMGETFDDMCFHKACHPISPPAKRNWAKDANIARRLAASGHGAAAIRLPAIPSEAAILKTALALARAAAPVIKTFGHTLSTDVGDQLAIDLRDADDILAERAVVTRVQTWASIHASEFAFCAGILQHLHETSGRGRNTLLSAYSVRKLMSDNQQQVANGVAYSRAANNIMRRSLEQGTYADVALTF